LKVLKSSLTQRKVGSFPQLETTDFPNKPVGKSENFSGIVRKMHIKGKRTKLTDFMNLYALGRRKCIEMVLKYRTENFCNFQSNETRKEYEE
jgi:hypothetical protein